MNYYNRYLRKILSTGEHALPRGLETICLKNVVFSTHVGITYQRIGGNPLIGFMEGLQFIAGVGSIKNIERVAPNALLPLFTSQSLYGLRVGNQLQDVVSELLRDCYSRRACIVLAKPDEPLNERPCTTSLQYQIFDNSLYTIVSMRSSDAIYGLPYDLIQFGLMSQVISKCVGVDPGFLVVNIANAHIYVKTWENLKVKTFDAFGFSITHALNSVYEYKDYALKQIEDLDKTTFGDEFGYKRLSKGNTTWSI